MTSSVPVFFVAIQDKLQAAIDKACESKSKIASLGGLSNDTLTKALKGGRVMRVKANQILKGLAACGVDVSLDDIFKQE